MKNLRNALAKAFFRINIVILKLSFLRKPEFYLIVLAFVPVVGIIFFRDIVYLFLPMNVIKKPNTEVIVDTRFFDMAKFIAYVIGGILLIWQIMLINRRTKAAEKTADASAENAKSTLENIRILEKGQVQERFKNAITQLGDDNEAVNLGAIYTLHHIAKDSNDLRKTVFDIICAYIRATTSKHPYQELLDPSIPIQTSLNLLFRDESERSIYQLFQADLHGAYLYKANLYQAVFNKVNFTGANLSFANLESASLAKAILSGANLENAYLNKTQLPEADLFMANFTEAVCRNANFRQVNCFNGFFIGSELLESDFRGANLDHSWFSIATLNFVDLQAATLNHTHLEGAELNNTNLQGNYINNCKVNGTTFNNVNFKGVSMDNSLFWNFESRIKLMVELKSSIKQTDFNSGLFSQQEYELIKNQSRGKSDFVSKKVDQIASSCIGKPSSFKNCLFGTLGQEDAAEIIKSFEDTKRL